jgi:hypothetical protein
MKTSLSLVPAKSFLGIFICVFVTSFVVAIGAKAQSVRAAAAYPSGSSVFNPSSTANSRFQAAAFPVLKPMQVRVVFENSTPYQVLVSVSNSLGQIMYNKVYSHLPKYYGILDFSRFPAGEYTVEVSCGPTIGKTKYVYRQTFQIRSHTDKTIIAWNSRQEKKLFTKRLFLSGR